jgi:hypothetical protein
MPRAGHIHPINTTFFEIKSFHARLSCLAFHIGARVAAKARAGEVLVSSAVKD